MLNHIHFLRLCVVLFAAVIASPWATAQDVPPDSEKLQTTIRIEKQMRQLFAEGKYADALPLAKEAVALWGEMEGPNSKPVANMLLWQGQIEGNLARYVDAEKSYLQALKINTALFGPDHPELTGCLSRLAFVADDQGKYADAEILYRKALAIYEKSPTYNERNYATCLDNFGVTLQALGKIEEAEAMHRRALPIIEQALGRNHPDYAFALSNLGQVYQKQAKYVEASLQYQQAVSIKEQWYRGDHLDLAPTLTNWASVLIIAKKYEDAERHERRSLAIREKWLPAGHPDIAKSVNSLAIIAFYREQFPEAEELYRKALAIFEKSLPADHPSIATALQNLAVSLMAREKFAEASQLHDRAEAIYIKAFGKDHPDLATFLDNKLGALIKLEKWRDAAEVVDRERHITHGFVTRVLPGLSAKQQLLFLAFTDKDHRHTALSLGLRQRDSQEIVTLSANWQLNGKSLAQEALTQNSALLRGTSDPKLTAEVNKLLTIRRQLASLVMGASEAGGGADRRQQIEELENLERQLTEQLSAQSGRKGQSGRWADVSDVRKSIPQRSVLIDIARFYPHDFDTKVRAETWKPLRYAAWIIPPAGGGEIKIVDLGEAKPIDDAIKAVQKAMNDAQKLRLAAELTHKEEAGAAEREAQKTLADLAKLAWQPLVRELPDNTQQILLSPDGSLWVAPWCALPVDDGKYLVEKHSVRYLVSGRDLLAERSTDKAPARPIIFADPNFDLDHGQVEAATRAVLRGTQLGRNEIYGSTGPKRSQTVLPKVVRLKGTADEAAAIKTTLADYAHQEPTTYLERYASESMFKAVRGPQVLVLSTHGYFLPEQETGQFLHQPHAAKVAVPLMSPGLTIDGKAIENPLLRCGLLLAGCNQPASSRGREGTVPNDDGILTGMEIADADLRGTELVVLSACETGVGQVDVDTSEGVAGLRQAFQLAGAKSVVATLWQIPDQETATLMTAFFEHLAAGESKAEALRSAQLELISAHREKYSAAHPYFWAAFTVTGE